MKRFVNDHWFNIVEIAIILFMVGVAYSKTETRVTQLEKAIESNDVLFTEIRNDIKDLLQATAAIKARIK